MLSWEFPPVVVGGLGRHVHQLSIALVAAGHEVTVVTRHVPGAPLQEYVDGVRVVRAPEDPPLFPLATPSLLAWTMAFNHALTRAALRTADSRGYDVIHAHDWLVTHAAVTLKEHFDRPLIATIHATEAGRHQGWLPGEMSKSIHSVEYWLGHEAHRVLVCSGYMRWEVSRLLELPAGKVEVVPNGVNASVWRAGPRSVVAARSRYAGEGPVLGFAGRLVYEKGVQDLISALPRLRSRHLGLRLVIAGDGPYQRELQDEVHGRRLQRAVSFTGFLDEGELPAVLAAMDAVVVPSIYEPFGMVALEAAAAGAPLAVAATGGLTEIVEPGVTGVTFPAKDPDGLTEAVSSLLADASFAGKVAQEARAMVAERYSWATVARRTVEAYGSAIRQARGFDVKPAAPVRSDVVRPRIVVPEGNLLAS
ncbi:MAG TPA: glycosyltransferase family 4 protein [Planosporangium sp.]|nr:glycosyltransferase family 4 protein [Planosporangium sp.]